MFYVLSEASRSNSLGGFEVRAVAMHGLST